MIINTSPFSVDLCGSILTIDMTNIGIQFNNWIDYSITDISANTTQTFANQYVPFTVDITDYLQSYTRIRIESYHTDFMTQETFLDETTDIFYVPESNPYVVCFLENAPVLTPTGYKAISKLSTGDLVLTSDNRQVPIQRVIRSRVASGPTTNPYIIPKGMYGATKRLLISPNHCVEVNGCMKEARTLKLQQEDSMNTEFDYYNLELPCWKTDNLVVAGVTVESCANIRRVRMSFADFKKTLVKQYGKITPAILHKIRATCRIVDGSVEVPVQK